MRSWPSLCGTNRRRCQSNWMDLSFRPCSCQTCKAAKTSLLILLSRTVLLWFFVRIVTRGTHFSFALQPADCRCLSRYCTNSGCSRNLPIVSLLTILAPFLNLINIHQSIIITNMRNSRSKKPPIIHRGLLTILLALIVSVQSSGFENWLQI